MPQLLDQDELAQANPFRRVPPSSITVNGEMPPPEQTRGGALPTMGAPLPTALPKPSSSIEAKGLEGTPSPVSAGAPGAALATVPTPSATAAPVPTANEQRLKDLQIPKHHNPFLRALGITGDALLETFAPRAAQVIPGTSAHHQLELAQAQNAVEGEQYLQNQPVERRLKSAQATEQESLPEMHEAQNEVKRLGMENQTQHNLDLTEIAGAKNETEQQKNENARQANESKLDATLHEHGYKRDDKGGIEPLTYEEMSEEKQAVHDLKGAQAEAQEATAQLKKAQAENQPQMIALAQARLASAQQAHQIAIRRLVLSEEQTEARLHGTEHGQALPGSLLTDEGQSVGSSFQANIRPTGSQRNKADLATSAHDNIATLKSIVQKRQDIFGPAAGRKTEFDIWLGSQDPDAQRFRAARTIAADHLAGMFGGRSEAALQQLDQAIGQFKTNPAAVAAGLDQIDKSTTGFIQKGTPRTTGSNAAAANPTVTAPGQEPKVGTIENGYRYKGGGANKKENWEPVK